MARLVESTCNGGLDASDPEIDRLSAEEVEFRLDAYKNGQLQSVTLEAVLPKYK